MARRLEPAARRAEILATASQIIAEEGYRGLTLRELARRCEISAPGLLHYFDGLPEVLIALLEERDRSDAAQLGGELQVGSVREFLDMVVAYNEAHPDGARLFAVLQSEALDPGHPAHAYFRRRTEQWADAFAAVFATEYGEAAQLTRLTSAILDGLQLHWLQDPEHFSLTDNWRRVADAIFPSQRRIGEPDLEALNAIVRGFTETMQRHPASEGSLVRR